MNTITKTYVGVDVSKNYLDVSLNPLNKDFREKNNKKGVANLLKKIENHHLEEIVCEASGGYESLLVYACIKANKKIRVADPRRVRNFAKAMGAKAKTDAIDAHVIAQFAATIPEKYERQHLSAKHSKLQELAKYKDRLKATLAAEKLRLSGPVYSFSEKHIAFLEKEIKSLCVKIENIINSIEKLKEKTILLQTMPGIGKETAIALIVHLPELGTLGPKKVASLLGVAPFNKESGNYKGVSRIKDGRPKPRKALYMAALSSSRHCPVFKEFYDRLIKKGKAPKKALVAVMRRMAVVLDAMLANNTEWINKIS